MPWRTGGFAPPVVNTPHAAIIHVPCSHRREIRQLEPAHDGAGQPLAAPATKWKGIHQYRANLPVQLLSHEVPRTVQTCLYGFRLKIEKVRRFLDAQSLDHSSDEDNSEGLRQIVGCPLNKSQNFPLRHRFFRIVRCSRLRELDDLGVTPARFKQLEIGGRAFSPQPPERFVDRDAGQPGCKAGFAPEPVEMGERVYVGFLHRIFGLAVIAQYAAGNAVQPPVVPLHDGAKRVAIADERATYKIGIVGTADGARCGRLTHDSILR